MAEFSLLTDGYATETKGEEWRPIPGYEGLYEASNLGRIRTAEGKTTSSARFEKRVWKQRILKPKAEARGTPDDRNGKRDKRVNLWKDGKEKTLLVSRLVAMAFLPIPYDKLTVNHINGDPMDNRIENLEWCTHAENNRHALKTGLYGSFAKPVTLVDQDGVSQVFPSMGEASRFLGQNYRYVCTRLNKGYKTANSRDGQKYEVFVNDNSK